MPDITIHVEGVSKLLKKLNPNKATGPDGISTRILQLTAEELAPALCIIFQKSLDTGEIPKSWLQTNISPIFKKGDRTLASNYRPVSLTSVCSKILEHIVHSNIMNHFDQYSILTDKQHGFRRKHSTESQLILTTHDLAKPLNSKSQVDMIIMDFSKAFDVVPHNRLLRAGNCQKCKSTFLICPCHKHLDFRSRWSVSVKLYLINFDVHKYVKFEAISLKFDILSISAELNS